MTNEDLTEPPDEQGRTSRGASSTASSSASGKAPAQSWQGSAQAGSSGNAKPHPRGGAHSAPKHSKAAPRASRGSSASAPERRSGAGGSHSKAPAEGRATATVGFVLGAPALVVAAIALVIMWSVGPYPVVALVLAVLSIAASAAGAVLIRTADGTPAIVARIVCALAAFVSVVAVTASITTLVNVSDVEGEDEHQTIVESNVENAGDEALESVLDPDDEAREEMAGEVAETLEESGLSLDDMGLTTDDFSSWMFEGTGYELVSMEIDQDEGTATLTYDVTANKVDDLLEEVSSRVEDMDYDGITTMEKAYEEIGVVMLETMDETEAAVTEVEIGVTLENGTWTVDDDEVESLSYEIFYN